jgi:RNA-splicing ligase RtcB
MLAGRWSGMSLAHGGMIRPTDEPSVFCGKGIRYRINADDYAYIDPEMAMRMGDYISIREARLACAPFESDEVKRRIGAMTKGAAESYQRVCQAEVERWKKPTKRDQPEKVEPVEGERVPMPADVAKKMAAMMAKLGG